MKNAKKVFAMLIVLALAISMAIPVSAADTGKITIDGAISGQTYTLYQMADLSYVDVANGEDLWAYTVENTAATKGWYEFFVSQSSYFTLTPSADDANCYILKATATAEANKADIAKAAIAWAKANAADVGSTKKVVIAANNKAEFSALADGYYVVDTTTGTICSLDSVNGGATVEIKEKNAEPSVDKVIAKVENDAVNADATDVKIGDIVEFTITIDVEKGAENYVVTDKMDKGLTLVDSNGIAATSSNWKTCITLTSENNTAKIGNDSSYDATNNVIKVIIDGEEGLVGKKITLTYHAKVNANAVINTANKNQVTLTFGNDPTVNPKEDIVAVYPLSFDIQKVDDSNNPLPGAEFVIYQKDAQNNKTYLTFTGDSGTYLYNGTAPTQDEAKVLVASSSNKGKYVINGLEAGTYYIHEVTVPAGYNALSEDSVIVISTGVDSTNEDNITISYDGDTSTKTLKIVNNTGTELPETGATGTIIFITVGGLMVVAMGVLLVVRKRMSKVVYTR